MRMIRKLAFLAGYLLAVLAPSATFAAEVKADIFLLAPWNMKEGDKMVGVLPDLMAELEKRGGLTVQIQSTPYARVVQDIQTGSCDFSILIWNDERAGFATKGVDVVPVHNGVRAVKGASLKSYDDLKNLRISITNGLKIDPKFDADTSLKKDFDQDYTTGVKKVGAAHAEAVAGALEPIEYVIRKEGLADKFGDTLVLRNSFITVHYSKKAPHPELEAKVNEVLGAMVKDGTVKRIADRWLNR
jgi:polar amino acid transport system substrate-binding protein